MPYTKLDLWNQALGHLGVTTQVDDEDEVSTEAELCARYYDGVQDLVLRAAPWASAIAFSRLANFATRDFGDDWVDTDPPPNWAYAFSLPSDHLRPRYIAETYEPFELSYVGTTPVIACDNDIPILAYTKRQTNIAQWDIDLFTAVTYALAGRLAPGITGNTADLNNMFTLANEIVLIARANNANQQGIIPDTLPEWLTLRGQGITSAPGARFIYPHGGFSAQSLISTPSAVAT